MSDDDSESDEEEDSGGRPTSNRSGGPASDRGLQSVAGVKGQPAEVLKGNKFVRYVFLFVLALLILRLGWDVVRAFFMNS